METQLMEFFRSVVATFAGLLIGYAFGLVQNFARARNEKLLSQGEYKSAWAAMPGSGKRVAGLLAILALIQFGCPFLFNDGVQWWVSGGVVAGYGFVLYRQLRIRLAERA